MKQSLYAQLITNNALSDVYAFLVITGAKSGALTFHIKSNQSFEAQTSTHVTWLHFIAR